MGIDLAVVPVAGHGTRLLPATKSQPKEMLPVGRKPVVQYVVEELAKAGVRRLLFVTGAGKDSIENHFDINHELISYLRESGREAQLAELSFERSEVSYFYVRQRRQLGLGHAILCAEPFVGDQPFVVALGDSIIGRGSPSSLVQRMMDTYERTNADMVIAFEEVPAEDVVHYGIARLGAESGGAEFNVLDLIEKPSVAEAPSRMAVAGRYVLSPRIFAELRRTRPGKGGEIQLTDAIRHVLAAGGRCVGVPLDANERRYDIGNFESYFQALLEFLLHDPEYGAMLRQQAQSILTHTP